MSGAAGASGVGGGAGSAGSAGASGNGVAGASGSAGASGVGGAGALTPIVLSFTASPATLPDGGGMTTLSWSVTGADTLSIDHGVGVVSGTSKQVSVTATTIFSLTATNANGYTRASTAVVVGQNPSQDVGRYVAMISPNDGESFLAPATLRLFAAGYDQNVYTNTPVDGKGGDASQVQFFVDDTQVDQQAGLDAEYWIFRGAASGITAGQHRVWARAIYTNPDLVLDSKPALIDVAEPPTYAQTVELTSDVLPGAAGYELTGSAGARVRLNGNGHRILSANNASGPLTLQFVDAFNLGDGASPGDPGIDVTTTGAVTIEDSTFDTSNTLSVNVDGSATASIRRNVFRSNLREPIGQEPDGASTMPSVLLGGTSSGQKVFAGNNVGNGAVELNNTKNWLIGAPASGGTDADSNVLIGPRVGIHVYGSSNVELRRNFSHHAYYGGWSQGNNFELEGSPSILVEHNVIYGSSWPSRGVACEYRYNLVLDAGHEWLWPDDGANIHHNVFVGGENDVGGIYVLYDPPSVKFYNNTLDGQLGGAFAILLQNGNLSLSSNAFVNFPDGPTVQIEGGTLTADYNAFLNPNAMNYTDARTPAHDVSGTDPGFSNPSTTPFDLAEAGVWQRTTTAAAVLALYRARYTPGSGSPLIDKGDPAGGVGNDIGAVGAGTANAEDRFGMP